MKNITEIKCLQKVYETERKILQNGKVENKIIC